MIFDIFGSGNSKNPFPGYELKVGELCSLPATSGTNNGGLTRTLSVPAGCIPLCVKMEGGLSVYSGKGESPSYYLQVKDNNGKIYYYATRSGGSGSISSGSPSLYLNPLAAYDGDLKVASSITSVSITASNGAGNLISNYTQPKMSVTMWLEKIGGGALKCSKNPFVKPYFTLFEKRKNSQKRGENHAV